MGDSWEHSCILYSDHAHATLCRHFGYIFLAISGALGRPFYSGVFISCDRGATSADECTITEFQNKRCHVFNMFCHTLDPNEKLRLVDGWRESDGRVEIYFNASSSGVVCGDEWNLDDANAVCRQLGYKSAVDVSSRRRGSLSLSDRTMHYARCRGNETLFKDCKKQPSRSCAKEAEVTCKENLCTQTSRLGIDEMFDLDCPRGWYLYADYCYIVSNNTLTFADTEWDKGCSSKSLVSISSPHEQAFVLSLLPDEDANFWIGLKRKNADGFHWVNGDQITCVYSTCLYVVELVVLTFVCRYVSWANGEPTFINRRECVAIDSTTGYWRTVDCFLKLKRVCN